MQNWLNYAFPFLFIGFFIYRRTKRSIGFQKLSRGRLKLRLTLFSILGIVIFLLGFVHPIHFIGYVIGLGAGIWLGLMLTWIRRPRLRVSQGMFRIHRQTLMWLSN